MQTCKARRELTFVLRVSFDMIGYHTDLLLFSRREISPSSGHGDLVFLDPLQSSTGPMGLDSSTSIPATKCAPNTEGCPLTVFEFREFCST